MTMAPPEPRETVTKNGMRKLNRLLQRPDFRMNPLLALWRRFFWRFRWNVTQRPWIIPFWRSLRICLAKSGAGALIYYQGFSEPETADFILRFLKPGMVFVDIGAHIGEYTLLGAHEVGLKGEVHAFEPHPSIFQILKQNIEFNGLTNVVLNNCAVCESEREREFELCAEASVSSLKRNSVHSGVETTIIRTQSIRMDTYWEGRNKKIDLVKIDVEGAEMLVFLGAEKLLNLARGEAPVWIFECSADNYTRFGYRPPDLFGLLQRYGYGIWRLSYTRQQLVEATPDFFPSATMNLIAAKRETGLRSVLRTRWSLQ
ncbi:MAG: FkbM family methyltransferase [Deltaproteobacteria bacterium]|nr:FkbM family methyltransferase [Deltaproteobacteria bacterium]